MVHCQFNFEDGSSAETLDVSVGTDNELKVADAIRSLRGYDAFPCLVSFYGLDVRKSTVPVKLLLKIQKSFGNPIISVHQSDVNLLNDNYDEAVPIQIFVLNKHGKILGFNNTILISLFDRFHVWWTR